MMMKLEVFSVRRKIPAAPLNHAAVKINADVLPGPGMLLEELARNAAAPAAPVEDELVGLRRDFGKDHTSRRIVVEVFLSRANELPKIDRW